MENVLAISTGNIIPRFKNQFKNQKQKKFKNQKNKKNKNQNQKNNLKKLISNF